MAQIDSIREGVSDQVFEHPFVDQFLGEKLRIALAELKETGASCAEGFLPPEVTEALVAESDQCPFVDHSGAYLLAEQRVSNLTVPEPFEGFPTVGKVAALLQRNVHALLEGMPGAADYVPTEAKYNLYPSGDTGITAHRDSKRDKFLVAAFTLAGEAPFIVRELPPDGPTREETFAARKDAPIISRWSTKPGDLVLLRAPGFDGIEDGRPLHEVPGGQGGEPRLSLIYRMILEEEPSSG